jgi:2-methylcitrate dehydratase PrpD
MFAPHNSLSNHIVVISRSKHDETRRPLPRCRKVLRLPAGHLREPAPPAAFDRECSAVTALETPAPDVSSGATLALADFAARTTYDTLPAIVRERIPLHVLDFVAVAASGSAFAESSPAFRDGVKRLAGENTAGGPCTVIGDGRGFSPEHAAFLNGTWAHSLDFDDTNLLAALHPGAPVIPAVLALAEQHTITGQRVVSATAVGYEVTCRVGAALGQTPYDRGFHPTALAGVFGAVAAGGNLLGLDRAQIDSALGLAGSMAGGSMQYMEDGSWNKRMHPGLAARNALLALALGQSGVRGAGAALEGRNGALHSFSSEPQPHHLTGGLGEEWILLRTGIKPYPACRLTHGAIDAALWLRREHPELVQGDGPLHLGLHPRAIDLVGRDVPTKRRPTTTVDGQFSVYFQTAVALLDGDSGFAVYRRMADPDVHAVIDRLQVGEDNALPPAGAVLTAVGSGEEGATVTVLDPVGEPGPGLTWDLVEGKLDSATRDMWDDRRRRRIVKLARDLSAPDALTQLLPLLRA